MRRILLVKSRGMECSAIKSIIPTIFPFAALDEIECDHATVYLRSRPSPDLIIYAPRSVGRLGKRFEQIKMLARNAKILVYSTFRRAEHFLFDYLAVGVNGILSKSAHEVEQLMALDTVMRGDSYVDAATRINMLESLRTQKISHFDYHTNHTI